MELGRIKELITKGNQTWISAFKEQDPKKFATIFSEDGSIFTSRGDIISGRTAIEKYINPVIQKWGSITVLIETLNIFQADDLIYESGKYSYIFLDGTISKGKYVVIWKENSKGDLEIYRDIGLEE